MLSCRTPDAGQIYTACPACNHIQQHPLSCGNRNCPHCQNHETSQWIDRQLNKQLPVQYFMVTFTLPCQFRDVAYRNQRTVYSEMFSCASGTLKNFGQGVSRTFSGWVEQKRLADSQRSSSQMGRGLRQGRSRHHRPEISVQVFIPGCDQRKQYRCQSGRSGYLQVH